MKFSVNIKFGLVVAVGLTSSICATGAQAIPGIPNINGVQQVTSPSAPGLSATYYASSPPGGSAGPNYTLTVPNPNIYLSGYKGYAGINIFKVGKGLLTPDFGNFGQVLSVYDSTASVDTGYGFILQDALNGKYHSSSGGFSTAFDVTTDSSFPITFKYEADFTQFAPAWPTTVSTSKPPVVSSAASVLRPAIIFFGTSSCHSINQSASNHVIPGIGVFNDTGLNGYETIPVFRLLIPFSGLPDTHFNFTTNGN